MSYLGNQLVGGSIVSEYFSGTGSATTFNLTYTYGNEASVIVCVSGVKQRTDTYALINGQIVFTVAPASGTGNIELTYLGGRVVTNPYLSADTQGIIRINANSTRKSRRIRSHVQIRS